MDTTSESSGTGILIGFDIGSVSLNSVVMDENFVILENHHDYVPGKSFNVLLVRLCSLLQEGQQQHTLPGYSI